MTNRMKGSIDTEFAPPLAPATSANGVTQAHRSHLESVEGGWTIQEIVVGGRFCAAVPDGGGLAVTDRDGLLRTVVRGGGTRQFQSFMATMNVRVPTAHVTHGGEVW